MIWFKRDSLVGTAVLLSFLSLGFEGWLLQRARTQAAQSIIVLEQMRRESDELQRQPIPPSEGSEQAIIREVARVKAKCVTAETAFLGTGVQASDTIPAKPIDVYFEIADFVEKTREQAVQARVTIRPDEHFGFGSHHSDGPEKELLFDVVRQLGAVRVLVEALFEAHPIALHSVQREFPLSTQQRADRDRGRANDGASRVLPEHSDAADFFEFLPAFSLRSPGELESDAYRLVFSGETIALRSFLNRLSTGERPFVVRCVEVEPLNGAPLKIAATVPSTAPIPIVAQALSRFSVIVELIRPLTPTERPAL